MDLCGFHRFLGPEVGQRVAAFWDRVWTLLLVCKIRSLITSMTDDSMIRCIEPGSLESWRLAARMVIFIDFHGIEGSVVLGLVFYGFHRSQVILGLCGFHGFLEDLVSLA